MLMILETGCPFAGARQHDILVWLPIYALLPLLMCVISKEMCYYRIGYCVFCVCAISNICIGYCFAIKSPDMGDISTQIRAIVQNMHIYFVFCIFYILLEGMECIAITSPDGGDLKQ